MGKSSPSPPPAPDYVGAAEATGQSNIDAVRAQTQANRVNQFTPYGSVQYYQDPNAASPDQGWNQITLLSPEQQQLLDRQNQTSLGLSDLANQGLGYVKDALGNNITASDLPTVSANPTNDAYNQIMSRYQPQIEQSHKALETQLSNQGIMPGTEAYNNAMRTQSQAENDLRTQASLNSINTGTQLQQQQMDYQNQQLGLLTALQNNPINVLNAVRSGSQVTNPSFSSTPQQQNAGGVDYSGALTGTNNYNMGLYNSGVAETNAANANGAALAGTAATIAIAF